MTRSALAFWYGTDEGELTPNEQTCQSHTSKWVNSRIATQDRRWEITRRVHRSITESLGQFMSGHDFSFIGIATVVSPHATVIEAYLALAANTYANVAAILDQKRTITLLTFDELKFDNPRTPTA